MPDPKSVDRRDEVWTFVSDVVTTIEEPEPTKPGMIPIGDPYSAYYRRRDECSEPPRQEVVETPSENAVLHCSAEYHIVRLTKRSTITLALYNLVVKVSHDSGRWNVSMRDLAEYFGVEERNMRAACQLLVGAGWLEELPESFYKNDAKYLGVPTVMCAIDHEQWSNLHPGKCCKKRISTNFDPLRGSILAVAGITVFPNQLNAWRKSGLKDDEILLTARYVTARDQSTKYGVKGRADRLKTAIDRLIADMKAGKRMNPTFEFWQRQIETGNW